MGKLRYTNQWACGLFYLVEYIKSFRCFQQRQRISRSQYRNVGCLCPYQICSWCKTRWRCHKIFTGFKFARPSILKGFDDSKIRQWQSLLKNTFSTSIRKSFIFRLYWRLLCCSCNWKWKIYVSSKSKSRFLQKQFSWTVKVSAKYRVLHFKQATKYI